MLLYNSVAVAVLANAGTSARLVGVLTWPAVAVHAALAVWCFCRFYYCAFYVIEHYVDPSYKFAGILAFVQYLCRRRRE